MDDWFSTKPIRPSLREETGNSSVATVRRTSTPAPKTSPVAAAMAAHQYALVSHVRALAAARQVRPHLAHIHELYRQAHVEVDREVRRQRAVPAAMFRHPIPTQAGAEEAPAETSSSSEAMSLWKIVQDAEAQFDGLVKEGPSLALQDYVDRLGAIIDSLASAEDKAVSNHWDVLAKIIDKLRQSALETYNALVAPAERTRDELVLLGLVVLLGGIYLFGTAGGQTLLRGYARGVPHLAAGLGKGVGEAGAGVGQLAAGGGVALAKL
jgi:hypothetical protein